MPALTTILFDLGSTLIHFTGDFKETSEAAYRAAERSLRENGISVPADFQTRYPAYLQGRMAWRDAWALEIPAPALMRDALVNLGLGDVRQEVIERALQAQYGCWQPCWQAEEDARPTLAALKSKGYQLAVVSNAGYEWDVQVLIDRAGLRPYFSLILSSAACGYRKPRCEIFKIALAQLAAHPSQTAMIGDLLETDVLGANRCGLVSIWLTRRARAGARLNARGEMTPRHTLGALSQLGDLVDQIQLGKAAS